MGLVCVHVRESERAIGFFLITIDLHIARSSQLDGAILQDTNCDRVSWFLFWLAFLFSSSAR